MKHMELVHSGSIPLIRTILLLHWGKLQNSKKSPGFRKRNTGDFSHHSMILKSPQKCRNDISWIRREIWRRFVSARQPLPIPFFKVFINSRLGKPGINFGSIKMFMTQNVFYNIQWNPRFQHMTCCCMPHDIETKLGFLFWQGLYIFWILLLCRKPTYLDGTDLKTHSKLNVFQYRVF